MFAAFASADVFGRKLHLHLEIGKFQGSSRRGPSTLSKFGQAPFSTPIDELQSAFGKTQALCREPDKVVFARVVRGRVSTFLASAPVEFAQGSQFLDTVRLRLLGSVLVCVFYSGSPEGGVSYRFLRDGEVLQESESPFLDVSTLAGGPGG